MKMLNKTLIDDMESKKVAIDSILSLIEKNECKTGAEILEIINTYKEVLNARCYELEAKADNMTEEQFPNGL